MPSSLSLLSRLPPKPVPPQLLNHVLQTIEEVRRRGLRQRAILSAISLVALTGYMLANWTQLRIDFQASSFFELLRLTISDPDLIIQSGQDFLLGLLESLPLEPILVGLLGSFSAIGTTIFLAALHRSYKTPTLFPSQ